MLHTKLKKIDSLAVGRKHAQNITLLTGAISYYLLTCGKADLQRPCDFIETKLDRDRFITFTNNDQIAQIAIKRGISSHAQHVF